MNDTAKWFRYIWISLLLFCAFLLEYFSLFIIEMPILQIDIWNYTANQRSTHHLIMVGIWIIYIGCKVMTFIDWQTLKVIGEAKGKDVFQFITQYMYYIMEVVIVLLIVMFGQKAFETRKGKKSEVPFGGMVLAFTWGIFHFVSRGVGIEIWNGISCMIFSMLSGIMYLKLGRNYALSYFFIAIGYLL